MYSHASQPGPSRPHCQASPDLLGSSPDFGEFKSARDDAFSVPKSTAPTTSQRPVRGPLIDLLSDEHEDLPDLPWPPDRSQPLHISLPPRPSEISPDYEPPIRSPRRLSELSFPGPRSPPQVSDVVFDPFAGHELPAQNSFATAQSKLLNTLATTTKIASRWRSAIDHHTFNPPSTSTPEIHSETATPIDISHTSPFARRESLDIPYIPPSGAPGFVPQNLAATHIEAGDDWSGTKLLGRKEATAAVLDGSLADALRAHLPPRHRLSPAWTLLFSLDQHGASLATLYRLVEDYALGHKSTGNVVIIRDGRNHIFGAFVNESIIRREGQYYGGGDSFLFKALQGAPPLVFRWTGRNQYFALCESSLMSFGGGAGTYGLVVDATFTHNSSATCPTFDNDVLCSAESLRSTSASTFDCVGLEVWATR